MKRLPTILFLLASAAVGGLYAWARARSEYPEEGPEQVVIEGSPKHLVTLKMATASRAMLDRPVQDFA
ncbi:hypothetical protein ACYOEI_32835, partial [Singulisphaera rosea]